MIFWEILLWIVAPAVNFVIWYQIGFQQSSLPASAAVNAMALSCPPSSPSHQEIVVSLRHLPVKEPDLQFFSIGSAHFQKHREERIVKLNYPHNTTIVNYYSSSSCETIANHLFPESPTSCFGIVLDKSPMIENSHLLLRYEHETPPKATSTSPVLLSPLSPPTLQFSGFFSKPGNLKGRKRFAEKLKPLLASLEEVEKEMDELLLERGIRRGDDVVVMVLNEGEMDLFMNFVCSCHLHNISLEKIIVFSASGEIVPLITATGALGYYHGEFASASKEHSVAYLDGVFVDLMWFKSFSVWLLLHLQRNVLFQDIDIIWLKDPFPFFHNSLAQLRSSPSPLTPLPDAFLSDDGQRASPRFSPFYANSGFYYFLSNLKTIHVSWLIMLTFDVIQSGGSHQNVFTQRLLETFDQFGLVTQSLSQKDFTNGATYHHTPSFITRMQQRKVIPFMFHMCWTANKQQKLEFFNASHMWYLREGLGYQDFKGEGKLNQYVTARATAAAAKAKGKGEGEEDKGGEKRLGNVWKEIWNDIEGKICSAMPNSP